MITDLKPYPKYKQSEIEWIGEIPVQWEVKRNKFFMCEVNNRSQDGSEELLTVSQYTGISRRRERQSETGKLLTNAESLVGYKIVEPNDLVMNIMLAWNGSLGVSTLKGIVSPAYCVYRIQGNIHPRYIHYLLRTNTFTSAFKTVSTGIVESRLRLYPEVFLRLPSLLPPLSEQKAIVRFLDYMDRRIRRYIRAKQKLIKLLEEQKQVVIHKAVTRGLDPNVRLKPSGVEWLGDVPEHWKGTRIKHIARILRGKFTHRPRNDPSLYDGSYPFIQTGEVARAKKMIQTYKQTLNDRGYAVSKMFPAMTLVMTIAANIGDVAILDFEACFPDSIVGFVPHSDVDTDYLYYLFRAMKPEFLLEAPVNTQGNLNVDRIGARGFALPPLIEQQQIVRDLEIKTLGLDYLLNHIQNEIELLREYRTRLIADVVTGKLDVREIAAQLPDEFEEEEIIYEDEIISEHEEYSEDSYAEAEA